MNHRRIFILFLSVSLFSMVFTLSAAEFTVNNSAALESALQQINANGDADNTIILGNNITVNDITLFYDHVSKNKRIFIKSNNGANTLTFSDGVLIPKNLQLVFDVPNDNESNVFSTTGTADFLRINGNMELRNGVLVEAAGVYLGTEIPGHPPTSEPSTASLILSDKGTLLKVTNSASTPHIIHDIIDDKSSLLVKDRAMLEITPHGEFGMNGNAYFNRGNLVLSSAGIDQGTFSAGTGGLYLENFSFITGTGRINADQGVHLNKSAIMLDNPTDVLTIHGGLWLSSDSMVKIKADNTAQNAFVDVASGPTALDGSFVLDLTPQYYGTTPREYSVLTSNDPMSGDFDVYRLLQSRYGTVSKSANSTAHDLRVNFNPYLDPYRRIARTFNESEVGRTLDSILQSNDPAWTAFLGDTFSMSDARLLELYNELSGEIYADMLMSMPSSNAAKYAFDRVGWDSQYGHVFYGPQYRLSAVSNNRAFWAQGLYDQNQVDTDGNAAEFKLKRYGVVGGFDQTLIGGKSALGIMFGYSNPKLTRHNDEVRGDDYLIGLYGATRVLEAIELKLWGGVGKQYYNTKRYAYGQTLQSNNQGNNVTASAEIAMPLYNGGPLVIKPVVGYDYYHGSFREYNETGDPLLALHGNKTSVSRQFGRIGLMGEIGESHISIYGGGYYRYLFGGDRYAVVQNSFVGGGPDFMIRGVDLGTSYTTCVIGFHITLDEERTKMIFGDYTVDMGKRSTLQTGSLGFQKTF